MILRGRATPLEEGDFNFEISGEFVTVSELLSTQLFLRVSEQGVVLWRGGFISGGCFHGRLYYARVGCYSPIFASWSREGCGYGG